MKNRYNNHNGHLPFKKSYVFLNVKIKKINEIIEEIITLDEVKEVHAITGEKDLLVVLDTKAGFSRDEETILDVVTNKIGNLKGVEKTETIIPVTSRFTM